MARTSSTSTRAPTPTATALRTMRVCRSVPGPLGGGRRGEARRGRSSRSSRKDKDIAPGSWPACQAMDSITAAPAGSGRQGPDPAAQPARVVLGRYRLERRIGAGGFGVVWLAFDEKLEREVAVKVIQRDGDDPVPARAEREARVAARLNHPGIVALYELASDDESVYLVSELVPGRTLAELMRA